MLTRIVHLKSFRNENHCFSETSFSENTWKYCQPKISFVSIQIIKPHFMTYSIILMKNHPYCVIVLLDIYPRDKCILESFKTVRYHYKIPLSFIFLNSCVKRKKPSNIIYQFCVSSRVLSSHCDHPEASIM